MKKELLNLIPKSFLCPFCGKWHEWRLEHKLSYYDSSSSDHIANLECASRMDGFKERKMIFYFKEGICHYKVWPTCRRANLNLDDSIRIDNIIETLDKPQAIFFVDFLANNSIGNDICYDCDSNNNCQLVELADASDGCHIKLKLGFEFEHSEYNKYSGIDQLVRQRHELQNRENGVKDKEQFVQKYESVQKTKGFEQQRQAEQSTQQGIKEDVIMKKTSIWEQLYEHSPKENVEIAKKWAEKYKSTLKWVIPVVCIYGAYRILNAKDSALTVENIDTECKNKLGFKFDALKDKKALRELMVLGGASAGAYAAIKTISTIYNKEEKEISVEELEEGMDKLETTSKKFGWIQPKTEALLPLAVSVIVVYVMTNPAGFEKVKDKVSNTVENLSFNTKVYLDMAKLFVADKLHVDLENEEEVRKLKKFTLLTVIVGIGVLLYGRKILGDKAVLKEDEGGNVNNKYKEFIAQIISVMEKLMPSAFAGITTFLIAKKFLKADDDEEIFEDVIDVPNEGEPDEETSEHKAGESGKETSEPKAGESGEETGQNSI